MGKCLELGIFFLRSGHKNSDVWLWMIDEVYTGNGNGSPMERIFHSKEIRYNGLFIPGFLFVYFFAGSFCSLLCIESSWENIRVLGAEMPVFFHTGSFVVFFTNRGWYKGCIKKNRSLFFVPFFCCQFSSLYCWARGSLRAFLNSPFPGLSKNALKLPLA